MVTAALKELEKGHRRWSDPLQDLKEEMLKPSDVLSTTSYATGSSNVCKAFNYGREGCARGAKCSYRHICEDCLKARKKAESQSPVHTRKRIKTRTQKTNHSVRPNFAWGPFLCAFSFARQRAVSIFSTSFTHHFGYSSSSAREWAS